MVHIDREKGDCAWVWQKLDHYIAQKRLKQTKQRNIIVSGIIEISDHFNAEQLGSHLRRLGYNVGMATIYRTLALLKESGVLNQVTFEKDESSLFELNTPQRSHDHMICVVCGHIEEFDNQSIEKIQEGIISRHKAQLVSRRLNLYIRCSSCLT